jgi:hypothetical protein
MRLELVKAITCFSSFLLFRFLFRPKRRLNSAGSLMPEVGKYAGPVKDASFGPCQSTLCLPKFAFGVPLSAASGSVELWIVAHAGSQT